MALTGGAGWLKPSVWQATGREQSLTRRASLVVVRFCCGFRPLVFKLLRVLSSVNQCVNVLWFHVKSRLPLRAALRPSGAVAIRTSVSTGLSPPAHTI